MTSERVSGKVSRPQLSIPSLPPQGTGADGTVEKSPLITLAEGQPAHPTLSSTDSA